MLENIKVTLALHHLFQYFGEDHHSDSEPYLWVFMFKFDGSSIHQEGNRLAGKPTYFFNSGSHGNLLGGDSNPDGTRIDIPAGIGRWDTSLQSIKLTVPVTVGYQNNKPIVVPYSAEIPAIIGCLAVLWEENSGSEAAMEAGHNALKDLLKEQFEKVITDIDLEEVAFKIQKIMQNEGKTVEQAAESVINKLFLGAQNNITEFSAPVVAYAILNNIQAGDAISRDVPLGQSIHIFDQKKLAQGNSTYEWGASTFNDMLAQDSERPEAGNWAYNLHGSIWPHIELRKIPKEMPAAKRLEISSVQKADNESGHLYISRVGGLHDGVPWALNRGDAVDLLRSGAKTFFTRRSDGAETEVVFSEGTAQINHAFLHTVANTHLEDNLGSLPPNPTYWRVVES